MQAQIDALKEKAQAVLFTVLALVAIPLVLLLIAGALWLFVTGSAWLIARFLNLVESFR